MKLSLKLLVKESRGVRYLYLDLYLGFYSRYYITKEFRYRARTRIRIRKTPNYRTTDRLGMIRVSCIKDSDNLDLD